ncbi:GntR family transcriptional regulator [Nocardioides sp.]|uniref:FadR/GntR family transcriptional regulator n=1 Tax=Nocardioides sp. TaxID=35761 RepID=UPI00262BFAC6|nr:GntR family transcriptional regulator [Nocardioides sp.]
MGAEVRPALSPARAAIFSPIGDEGRALLVERRIAEAIHTGLLSDGERLPTEAELAQLFGVAPVTAREALVALRADGLVTTVRGRNGGSFITAPHGDDITHRRLAAMSRVELRDRASQYLVVLTGCAELAAERVDPDEAEYIRGLIPDLDDPDVGAWRRAETEFWLAVAALTQSARLTREVIRLEADFGTLLRLPLQVAEHRAATTTRLTALADALETGAAADARRLTREQLKDAIEGLADLHAAMP